MDQHYLPALPGAHCLFEPARGRGAASVRTRGRGKVLGKMQFSCSKEGRGVCPSLFLLAPVSSLGSIYRQARFRYKHKLIP